MTCVLADSKQTPAMTNAADLERQINASNPSQPRQIRCDWLVCHGAQLLALVLVDAPIILTLWLPSYLQVPDWSN